MIEAHDNTKMLERMIDRQKNNDIVEAGIVELSVDDTGKVWLNIDGVCMLRIGEAKEVLVTRPCQKDFVAFKK